MNVVREEGESSRTWYTLFLLSFAYSLSYVDRQVFNLVVDPIKSSLSLTDTQVSFLQGAAFIAAYVLASPFFGRLVDTWNRRNILIAGVCAWSVGTILCGFAETFWQLAAARFAVGICEACVFPVGMSVIPEIFSTRRVPRALSLFSLGAQLGSAFSLLAGGAVIAFAASIALWSPALATLHTWQLAFVIVGAPGLFLAMLLFSMREPERPVQDKAGDATQEYTFRQSLTQVWQNRSFYGRIYLFCAANGIVFLSVPAWYPAYLMRVYGLTPTEVGLQLGALTLAFGGAGTLLGPVVARWLDERGYADASLRAAAISSVGILLSCLSIPYAPNAHVAMAINASIVFFCAFPTSLVAFTAQRVTTSRMRGIVGSLYGLTGLAVGYGIGPTLVALVTDWVFHDPKKVGLSLQLICSICALVVFYALVSNFRNYRDRMDVGEMAP
jgi:MFS family permease